MSTKFQASVWQALTKVPFGKVTTYGDIGKHIQSHAIRAIGTAVGKNPAAPIIPCHRVVLSDGSIGQYTHKNGVKEKIRLLQSEGIVIENGKVQSFQSVRFQF